MGFLLSLQFFTLRVITSVRLMSTRAHERLLRLSKDEGHVG